LGVSQNDAFPVHLRVTFSISCGERGCGRRDDSVIPKQSFALLIFSLLMVIMFEATNGFHDAANAVATVDYASFCQF
jgi:hypothetical protein